MTSSIMSSFENLNYDVKNNVTSPKITRFEMAKILGIRAEQIARGAEPLVQTQSNDVREIALQEYIQKKIPFIVSRTLPTGVTEYWKLQDLDITFSIDSRN